MSPEPHHIGKTPLRLDAFLTIGGDLVVARIGFGAMRLCGPGIWGRPRDPEAARMVLRRAIELGVTLVDTADAYGPEVNEQLIAETLHPYPEELVIATKGGLTRPRAGAWENDGRPEYLRAACEGSLRRLKLERIDLFINSMRPILVCHLRNPLVLSLICVPKERFVTSGSLTSALMSCGGRADWCQLSQFRTATITRIAHLKRYCASASAKSSPFYLGTRSKRAAVQAAPAHWRA